jgi:Zn-dependent protease
VQDSLKLGRVAGVKVGVNWSLFALAAMVAYFLATSRLPADAPGYSRTGYWAAGALTAVALLLGVLVHEGAHAVAARKARMHVDGITLWFMGGITRIEGESRSPLTELVIALVGPLASGAIGGISLGLSIVAQRSGWQLAAASLAWLGAINLLLGAFNLVPASPLDGGRVCHGLLWWLTKNRWLATRLTAGAGTVLGAICALAGLLVFEQGDAVDGVVLAIMGWFVLASAKREQLAGRAQHVLGAVSISDVMRPAVLAPGWLTLNAFWNEWVKPYPESAFLLEHWAGGGLAGVVTAQQLAAVPPGMHWTVRAQDLALALPPSASGGGPPPLTPEQPALAVAGRGGSVLPVEVRGAVVGVVLASDIAAMVAKGTPVPRRTWGGALWPSTPPSSRYAGG